MRQPRTLACIAALAATAVTLPAQSRDAWQSLVDAERAFAADAVRTTMREAFLAHLHPRSVMFNPGPVNGIELYTRAPARPGQLNWAPEVVDIAASGDLGYSTGPHQFRRTADGVVVRQGYFCSVWVRSATEPWKVLIDLGTSQPEPLTLAVQPRDPTPAAAVSADASSLSSLEHAERQLAMALPKGQAGAYRTWLAPHGRLYRDGGPPAEGTDAAVVRLAVRAAVARATPEKIDIATSGDLGYAYGALTLEGAAADAPPLYYVRVWRHDAQGWRVVLDVDTWQVGTPR